MGEKHNSTHFQHSSLSMCPYFMDQVPDVEGATFKHRSGMVWQRSKVKVTVPLASFFVSTQSWGVCSEAMSSACTEAT